LIETKYYNTGLPATAGLDLTTYFYFTCQRYSAMESPFTLTVKSVLPLGKEYYLKKIYVNKFALHRFLKLCYYNFYLITVKNIFSNFNMNVFLKW